MNMRIVKNRMYRFESVMKSEKFHQDLNESRALLHNLHTFKELREDFVWFLIAYPLSDSKKKVMLKMDGKKKFGVLSRHLMGICKKHGISDFYLTKFRELKEEEKYYTGEVKSKSWMYNWSGSIRRLETPSDISEVAKSEGKIVGKREILSNMLVDQTMEMLDFCFSKYDAREDKINQILEDV